MDQKSSQVSIFSKITILKVKVILGSEDTTLFSNKR